MNFQQLRSIQMYSRVHLVLHQASPSEIVSMLVDGEAGIGIATLALDADVIKAYVELGMGIGIVASMAYVADRDPRLTRLAAPGRPAAGALCNGMPQCYLSARVDGRRRPAE